MSSALVRQYAGAFLPLSHPARPALERAAAEGLCTLEWLPRGAVRVIAPWPWPTREAAVNHINVTARAE